MPQGSMLKYFKDRGGSNSEHGGHLHWPGTEDGFPFRGAVSPDLRDEEYANIALALDYHSDSFRLWEPEQKMKFDDVMDRIVNGWYQQHKRIDRWSDQHCGLVVWLEWVQIYGEAPSGKNPGVGHAQQQTVESAAGSGPFGIVPPPSDSPEGLMV